MAFNSVEGMHGGLMVSVRNFGLSSGSAGSSPGLGTALCSWARLFTLIMLSPPRDGLFQSRCTLTQFLSQKSVLISPVLWSFRLANAKTGGQKI